MARYGAMFGPDVTFLGVPPCDLGDPGSYAGADAVIVGAPFDGGTSHRPGARFGPQAIRGTDYLPHDGSRPHLALRVDPLRELRVLDAGDVEMPPGDIERSLGALQEAVSAVAGAGAIPVVLGGDHSIALPDVQGVAEHVGCGRVSVVHFDAHADTGDMAVRLAVRARPADAPAGGVRRGPRRPLPAGRAAWLLARAGDAGLDGRAGLPVVRDDRGGRPRAGRSA